MGYKKSTKIIHRCILFFKLDGIIVKLASRFPFFRKFIPSHLVYKSGQKIIKRDKAIFAIDPSDYMQWHIFSGIKEIAWQKAVAATVPFPGAVIMDIGCNAGAFTIKTASNISDSGKVSFFAFDPNPFIKEIFLKNLSLNKSISHPVHFYLAALGNENKEVNFSFDSDNSGAGRIDGSQSRSFKTKMITLDSFVSENNVRNICFIKIDVEGFEPYVFEGARNTIREQKPQLYFEITEAWHLKYGKSAVAIFEFLLETGYSIYKDTGDNLTRIGDYRREIEKDFQSNFYALYP